MNLEQTRQLGIEFDRRIQTLIPDTEFAQKLDTETIYSFLNQYQDKYVHEIYKNLDNIPSGTKLSYHIEAVLQSMLSTYEPVLYGDHTYTSNVEVNYDDYPIVDTARSYTFKLPENFYMYIRSVSKVSSTVSYRGYDDHTGIIIIPNQLMSQNEVSKIIETPYDSLRILRQPVVVLNQYYSKKPTITLIFDRYTKVEGLRIVYYKQPSYFNIMDKTCCELPMEVFDDIVTGAVDLYIDYAAGAEANKRRRQEEMQRMQRENNKDREQ